MIFKMGRGILYQWRRRKTMGSRAKTNGRWITENKQKNCCPQPYYCSFFKEDIDTITRYNPFFTSFLLVRVRKTP